MFCPSVFLGWKKSATAWLRIKSSVSRVQNGRGQEKVKAALLTFIVTHRAWRSPSVGAHTHVRCNQSIKSSVKGTRSSIFRSFAQILKVTTFTMTLLPTDPRPSQTILVSVLLAGGHLQRTA